MRGDPVGVEIGVGDVVIATVEAEGIGAGYEGAVQGEESAAVAGAGEASVATVSAVAADCLVAREYVVGQGKRTAVAEDAAAEARPATAAGGALGAVATFAAEAAGAAAAAGVAVGAAAAAAPAKAAAAAAASVNAAAPAPPAKASFAAATGRAAAAAATAKTAGNSRTAAVDAAAITCSVETHRVAPYRGRAHAATPAAGEAIVVIDISALASLGRVVGKGATEGRETAAVIKHRAAHPRPAAASTAVGLRAPGAPFGFAVLKRHGFRVSAHRRWRLQTVALSCYPRSPRQNWRR